MVITTQRIVNVSLDVDSTGMFHCYEGGNVEFVNGIPECVHLKNEHLTMSEESGLCFVGRQFIGNYNRGQLYLLPEHQLLNLILNVVYLRTLTLKGLRKRIAIYVEDARAEDVG